MAPVYWLKSHGSRSLTLLCIFVLSLQVTSARADAPDPASASPSDLVSPVPTKPPKCDQTFVSRGAGGINNGTFNSPELTNPGNHSRQCLYTFVAAPGERVELTFLVFNLRGTPPDGAAVGEIPACSHEYMDIYTEVVSPEAGELINSPFGGRFCGPIPPRRRVSLHRTVALSFYTDKPYTTSTLFNGRYQFINDSEFEVGTPVANTACSFTIQASKKRTGLLVSPTYPGTYPKDMTCHYQFVGNEGQRIRLEFRDFDLFFGGPHCPFDWVRVYDGLDNSSAVIGTYCGQQRNLVLYSSDHRLLVTFFTLRRAANTQNRGFKGIFEFSESFVKLDFISKFDGEHIRGSECDQKILSKKESTGFVYSPNWPYPYMPKIVCRYFIYGMQDSQNLERVRLELTTFEIPKSNKASDTCTDGYLKVYLKGQEATDSYDKFDAELCGEVAEASTALLSDGPRLVMVFSSGEMLGRGFKAKYTFETEYKVPGTAAPDGRCSFTYRSTSRKRGDINSPRYPSNYPSHTNCTYTLLATPNEQVTVIFEHFKVRADSFNTSVATYGDSGWACTEDWLEAWWLGRGGARVALGRWCSLATPGPLQSPRGALGLELLLHTDNEKVASGFKARYIFEEAKSIFGDCGGNMSGTPYGVITSPLFPDKYEGPGKGLASKTCNWYVTARPGYKLLINFDSFELEGALLERGCGAAVLRMWYESSGPPRELCGVKPPGERWQFLTATNTLRLSFIIADKSVGAAGWRSVWTEVREAAGGSGGAACAVGGGFLCAAQHVCISNTLKCDGIANCPDGADETHCVSAESSGDSWWKEEWAWPAWCGVSVAIALALVSCVLSSRTRRSRRRRRPRTPPRPPRPPPHPCARRLANVDTV